MRAVTEKKVVYDVVLIDRYGSCTIAEGLSYAQALARAAEIGERAVEFRPKPTTVGVARHCWLVKQSYVTAAETLLLTERYEGEEVYR